MARTYPEAVQAAVLSSANEEGTINTPPVQDFNTPAMAGSMQQFLADNLGQYVVIEFLIGTQETVSKAGVLYAVGTSVVTLYQELTQTFVTCDMFSIKFVTFYLPGHRPWQVNFPMSGQIPTQWSTPGQWGVMPSQGRTPYQQGMLMGQGGMVPVPGGPVMGQNTIAPGFAPSVDAAGDMGMSGQWGCSGGSAPAWG